MRRSLRYLPSSTLTTALLCLAVVATAQKPFSIVNVGLHQYEDGPPLPASYQFHTGDTVFLSFHIDGYKASGEDQKVHIDYRVEAFDPAGLPLAEVAPGSIDTELAPQDKEWKPKARRSATVPPWAPPGEYRLAIWAKDRISEAETSTEVKFRVTGKSVEPSETLVIRNFSFHRAENEPRPMANASYGSGQPLWARFDITGYKLGPKNALAVEYDIAVLSPAGKTLYTQPNAAVYEDQSFYPKRYVSGILNLDLKAGTPKGEYTIVMTTRDKIGGQTAETKHSFRID